METNKKISIVVVVLFGLGLIAGSFSIGVAVGFRKASFSYAWGEHYDRNFGGPRHGVFGFREGPQFMDAHGTSGKIINVDATSLVVNGRDNLQKIVLVDNDTSIQRMRDAIQFSNLKIDDRIIVIGDPNDQGQIIAKFIRVMP